MYAKISGTHLGCGGTEAGEQQRACRGVVRLTLLRWRRGGRRAVVLEGRRRRGVSGREG